MRKGIYGLAALLFLVETFANVGHGQSLPAALLGIAAGMYLCLFLEEKWGRTC